MTRWFVNGCMALLFIICLVPAPLHAEVLTIFASGMTRGVLERCGCPSHQTGGMEARGGFLNEVRKKGGHSLLVDNGGFFSLGNTPLADIQDQAAVQAMSLLHYDVVSLGRQELQTDIAKVTTSLRDATFQIVAANVTCTSPSIPVFWKPAVTLKKAGKKIGIVGVASYMDKRNQLADGWVVENFLTWPVSRIEQTVGQPVDLILLLTHEYSPPLGKWLENAQNAAVPIVAIALPGAKQFETYGKHTIVPIYAQGKYLVQIDIDFQISPLAPTVHLVSMDPDKYTDPEMNHYLDRVYQQAAISETGRAKNKPVLMDLPEEQREGDAYVGAEACKDCHTEEYNQWYNSSHRSAFLPLLTNQRYFEPDCINCHATGYGHPQGFTRYTATRNLAGIQCESCHGPGKLHAEKPEVVKARKTMDQAFCMKCHDAENSPGFPERFERAWNSVAHKPAAFRPTPGVIPIPTVQAGGVPQIPQIPKIPVLQAKPAPPESPAANP